MAIGSSSQIFNAKNHRAIPVAEQYVTQRQIVSQLLSLQQTQDQVQSRVVFLLPRVVKPGGKILSAEVRQLLRLIEKDLIAIVLTKLFPCCAGHAICTSRFTKCCACHEICTSSFTKCCACHEICTSRFTKCCACHEICTSEIQTEQILGQPSGKKNYHRVKWRIYATVANFLSLWQVCLSSALLPMFPLVMCNCTKPYVFYLWLRVNLLKYLAFTVLYA